MTVNETATRSFRIEEDALGEVEVPSEHLWGAQTQRSPLNFTIGVERFRWGRPVTARAVKSSNMSGIFVVPPLSKAS
jgi:fumarate hydratase class II